MGKKVIVIDDSRAVRQLVRAVLEGAGYDVIEAVDGVDGLAKISANADAGLVLCDMNMPGMTGIDMLERVWISSGGGAGGGGAGGAGAKGVSVVMLTTESGASLVRRAKSFGAKGWIVKPFDPDQLLAAVKKLAGDP